MREVARSNFKLCMHGCAGCLLLADLLRVQLAKLEPDSNATEPKDELVGDVQCAPWKSLVVPAVGSVAWGSLVFSAQGVQAKASNLWVEMIIQAVQSNSCFDLLHSFRTGREGA